MKISLAIIFLLLAKGVFPQDTIKVMQYNLMYYGQTSSFCTISNNDVNAKNACLRTIIKYAKPDIFTVNEIAPLTNVHQSLMNNCLNTDGVTYYDKCTMSNVSVSDLSNELYYNSEKLGFVSQVNIPTSVRDINIYRLYYKAWNLSTTQDTAYVICIVMHLKAGNTSGDASERAAQTNTLMNYLNTLGVQDNYIVMGDFNVYNGYEQCYQNLLSPANQNIRFNDPINQIGDWHSNPLYAGIHTQSTHTTSSGCFATGGMDDRFDHIMISDHIKNGSDHILYIPGSCLALGEDGNHLNESINNPVNTSAPDSVIQALYGMSDHLPVTLMLRVNQTVGIKNYYKNDNLNVFFENPVKDELHANIILSHESPLILEMMNNLGQLVYSERIISSGKSVTVNIPTGNLDKGLYFFKIIDNRNYSIVKKVIKD